MKNFQYQIIRFCPDRVSGEFVNLGVVVYSPELKQLCVETVEQTSRIVQVFPRTNANYVLKLIKYLQESLNDISDNLSSGLLSKMHIDIQSITKKVLPLDDSSLFFAAPEQILDVDIKLCASYLFESFVGTNLPERQKSNFSVQTLFQPGLSLGIISKIKYADNENEVKVNEIENLYHHYFNDSRQTDTGNNKNVINLSYNEPFAKIFGGQTVSNGDGYALQSGVQLTSQLTYQPYENLSKLEKV